VAAQGLSVRQTEHLVARHLRGETTTPPATKAAPSADVRHLEQSLEERLGAKVSIEHGRRGGRLVIRYSSLDELDGILGHIK
jgi:ParB family chromosome partitioning protein